MGWEAQRAYGVYGGLAPWQVNNFLCDILHSLYKIPFLCIKALDWFCK